MQFSSRWLNFYFLDFWWGTLCSTHPSVQHVSSSHESNYLQPQKCVSSTLERQFNTNVSVQRKCFSSTQKRQFKKYFCSTQMRHFNTYASVPHKYVFLVYWPFGGFYDLEVTHMCWTDAFVWNWFVFYWHVELTAFWGWKRVAPLMELTCWTAEMCLGLRDTLCHWVTVFKYQSMLTKNKKTF